MIIPAALAGVVTFDILLQLSLYSHLFGGVHAISKYQFKIQTHTAKA